MDVSNLEALRQRAREAAKVVTDLEQKLAVANTSLPLHERLLKTLQAELPASSVQVRDAEVPTCQICEVPIDRVLAEGCKLSHKLPDLDGLRQRNEALQKQIDEKKTEVESTRTVVITVNRQLPNARTERDTLQQAVKKAERLSDSRSTAWSQGKKNLDDIQRLEGDWASWELAQEKVAKLQEQIDKKRESLAAFRDQQVEVFSGLSIYFNSIIRAAVGPTASGKVTLDGNGMKLAVQLGGERSTAAIESLKVIAFDLAVMCMSMQGTTRLPAFLLHDSPREADLGLSVYHRLFDVVNGLEGASTSAFQYIVTTTTQPPPAFQQSPWLREVLRGAPPQERLLRCDLP